MLIVFEICNKSTINKPGRALVRITVLSALLAFFGCGGGSERPAGPPVVSEIRAVPNPANVLSFYIHCRTGRPASVRVEYGLTPECGRSTPEVPLAAGGTGSAPGPGRVGAEGDHRVCLLGLEPESRYYYRVVCGNEHGRLRSDCRSFNTGSIPEQFPEAKIEISVPEKYSPGINIVYLYPYLVAMDMAGKIVWYYRMTEGFKLINPVKFMDNGHLLLGIYCSQRDSSSLREITLAGEVVRDIPAPNYHHDFVPLPGGRIAYIRATAREINGESFVGDEIVEIDDAGAIVWQWNLFDHLQPDVYCQPCSKRYFYGGWGLDWTHSNTLIRTAADDSYLLSVRHLDSILKISRTSGDILWQLGGSRSDFVFRAGEQFRHQHALELTPGGRYLLFDNGNHRQPVEFSRAAEYELDPKGKTASLVWSFVLTGDNCYSSSYGDVDRLANGNILIADFHNTLTEVTPKGEVVWRAVLFQRRAKLHQVLRLPGLYRSACAE